MSGMRRRLAFLDYIGGVEGLYTSRRERDAKGCLGFKGRGSDSSFLKAVSIRYATQD